MNISGIYDGRKYQINLEIKPESVPLFYLYNHTNQQTPLGDDDDDDTEIDEVNNAANNKYDNE